MTARSLKSILLEAPPPLEKSNIDIKIIYYIYDLQERTGMGEEEAQVAR